VGRHLLARWRFDIRREGDDDAAVIQKKIALLGAPGVGKTSLVRRFVESIFDEKYLTTIGVKVDKKAVQVGGREVQLMIWDVAGAEETFAVPSSYIRGSAGYLLVVDGIRPQTVDMATDVAEQVQRDVGDVPFVLVANKVDLADRWAVQKSQLDSLLARGGAALLYTSALSGEGVEDAFQRLAQVVVS
jgi:small GTP-binding protein